MSTVAKQHPIAPIINPISIVSFLCITLAFFWVGNNYWDDRTGFFKLYMLMLVQITPFILCFTRQHYNYIAFVLFNHAFTYSFAKYNQIVILSKMNQISPEAITAIEALLVATIVLIIGYCLAKYFLLYRMVERERYQLLSLNRWQLILISTYVICVPLFLSYIPRWLLSLHFATMAADMVLLLCATAPGNEFLSRLLRFGVFLSTVWYFLSTGFLTMLGNLAGYIFISACLQRRYRQLIVPAILTVIASMTQNVKPIYRTSIYENPDMTISERVELLGTLIYLQYYEGIDLNKINSEDEDQMHDENSDTIMTGFSRVGDDSLERVISMTPSKVPYWEGESFSALPYTFIPRLFWANKPSRHIWNKFGRTYGYLSEDDYMTSVGVSYFAEGYMNFGYAGLYGVALLMGLVIALVERFSYYFLRGYYYFTFMCFLMPVLSYASDLTSTLNSILVIAVMLLLFRKQFLSMARADDYS